jgi:hypothetical protein
VTFLIPPLGEAEDVDRSRNHQRKEETLKLCRGGLQNMGLHGNEVASRFGAAAEVMMATGCPHVARILSATLSIILLAASQASRADAEVADQAKQSQNPIANMISVPFQNNANLNAGPERETLNVLNVQPVVPVSLGPDWNLITRTILPVISEPALSPDGIRTNGIGDMLFSAFFSPRASRGWIWGAGPAIQAPTHSNDFLGNHDWGLGPTFVVLHLAAGSPWVYGVLVNNVWSVSSSRLSHAYNNGLMQPFVNYNMSHGTYLVSSPIVTVNWSAVGGQQVTVPLGGGIGKIVHLGKLPVNMQLAGYCNVVRPTNGPSWQLRTQVQFLFPK